MPKRSMRQCLHPHCGELISVGSYCDKHKKVKDSYRDNAGDRGYNANWRKYRLIYLRNNPLCVECLKHGITTLATVVDHVIAHKGNTILFWDSNNHQALCKHCHDIKTSTCDGGFGR